MAIRETVPAVRGLPNRLALGLFVAFAAAALIAFWPTYLSRISSQPSYHAHAHGAAMFLWCAMLVAQAGLVALKRPRWHRYLGRASFVLVPVIAFTTLDFLHFRLTGVTRFSDSALYFVALIVNALVAFGILYALALYHRRNRPLHARFMIATIFPLFTPVTDRLIGFHWPELAPLMPTIGGATVLPFAGFLLADAILIGLIAMDWFRERRFDAFAVALVVTVAYHTSVLTFHEMPAWRDFAAWFRDLPL